jgi:hypothetical protein
VRVVLNILWPILAGMAVKQLHRLLRIRAVGRPRPRDTTSFAWTFRESRNVPEFERLYAAGDREAALKLLRKLDFHPLEVILVVRNAEPGATTRDAGEIVSRRRHTRTSPTIFNGHTTSLGRS